MLIDHLCHVILTNYGFQGHVMTGHYWFYFIWIPWPWKPYPWHSDHLCSINTSWDNFDRPFRPCDLDQLWFPRSRDDRTLLILFYLDSLTLKTIYLTLITSVALIHPGIMLIDHFAMWPWPTMVSKVTWWSDIIDFILFEFFDPENHILDTEITSLSFIDPEIIEHICVGSHLGRHLEFWTPATGERRSPPIFQNCTSIWRKWDQSHLLIIKTATGD